MTRYCIPYGWNFLNKLMEMRKFNHKYKCGLHVDLLTRKISLICNTVREERSEMAVRKEMKG